MKLSELVYNIITGVTLFENSSALTLQKVREYAYFLTNTNNEEGFSIDSDYKRNVDNVFDGLNEAIQRIATLEKLPPKIIKANSDSDGLIDLTEQLDDLDYVLNVYTKESNIEFRNLTNSKIEIDFPNIEVNVEYYPEIKFFGFEDISYHIDALLETETDNDVDLRQIGISNKTASYIALYCKGKLGRDIYGSEANQLINQAEAYFSDLDDFGGATIHSQNRIATKYKVNNYENI